MSKKVAILAKLEQLADVEKSKVVPVEVLAEAIRKGLTEKTLRPLPLSAFEKVASETLDFAQRYGLVKENEDGKPGPRGASTSSYDALVRTQHAEVVGPAMAVIDQLKEHEFIIALENGETRKVAFQPYWRKIEPESESASPATGEAGGQSTVTV